MKASLLTLALLAFLAGPLRGAVPTPPAIEKALVIEVTIPASPDAVWQAFTTRKGLITWLAPDAAVVLRSGGEWTARFPGGSTGGGTIISFAPGKELVISALAPDSFPTVRAHRTRAVFQFEGRGDTTVVRLTQTGWQEGPEWNHAYEYLISGNGQLLGALHHRFVNGPIDWQKEFGSPDKPQPGASK